MREIARLPYRDRSDAGRQLAALLDDIGVMANTVVLALPRGGVPVGVEVARLLHSPIDVLAVRKLGLPFAPEFAIGAIASGGVRVLNESAIREFGIPAREIERISARELRELRRRESLYRAGRPAVDLSGSTAIIVDDGIATGSTVRAAVLATTRRGADRIVVAVPVAASPTCDALCREGVDLVCPARPKKFAGIGQFYRSFPKLDDDDVIELLARPAEYADWLIDHGPTGLVASDPAATRPVNDVARRQPDCMHVRDRAGTARYDPEWRYP